MKDPDRIRQFLLERLGSMVGEWDPKPNGQMLLRAPGVTVSFYKTTGKILWQGKLGRQYEQDYRAWATTQKKEPAKATGASRPSDMSRSSCSFASAPRVPSVASSNPLGLPSVFTGAKGQKSTLNECTEFLMEMERGSSGGASNLWEEKPNGQMLARLCRLGKGNLSFYTTTRTLLFQGRDSESIKSKFYEWRHERLQSFQREYESLGGIEDEEPARKRQKVDEKKDGEKKEAPPAYSYSFSRQQDNYYQPSEDEYQSDEEDCKHCNRPISRHKQFEGDTMCFLSAKYKCHGRCGGRWWKGMALKIRHKALEDEGAFPPHTFPDCKRCKENSNVVLSELLSNDSSSDDRAGGGHQADLCKLCQKGIYCPRA